MNIHYVHIWNVILPALFNVVREHLAEMLQAGAIRPSKSSYSSNVVIVRKKDGSLRFCVDFRKLNSKTIKDAYAIPRVEDTLHLLAGAKYFTKLDLRSGYWQVRLQESDKPKTAFQVGTLGFYEFLSSHWNKKKVTRFHRASFWPVELSW